MIVLDAAQASFLDGVLAGLGLASTPWRQQWLAEWAHGEEGRVDLDYFNPWNTTQHEPGSTPLGGDPNQNNGNPVQQYQDAATGIAATVATMTNNYYPAVLATLSAQSLQPGTSAQIRTWGTTPFADELDAGWQPDVTVTPLEGDAMTTSERGLQCVATGEYENMKKCYAALVAAAIIDETTLGGVLADDDSVNSALMMRFRIQWVMGANAVAGWQALGGTP